MGRDRSPPPNQRGKSNATPINIIFEKYAANSPAANAHGGFKTTINQNRTVENATINSL